MTFPVYVSAGFGELISKPWLTLVKKIAVGVRQDIPNGVYAKGVNKLVEEIAKTSLRAIFMVGGWQWGEPDGTGVHRDDGIAPTPEGVAASTAQTLWAAKHYGMSDRVIIEVGPELNIGPRYSKDLSPLRDLCDAAWDAIKANAPGTPMIAASVSNVGKDSGMRALKRWMRGLPPAWIAGVHPYRTRGPREDQPDTFGGYVSPTEMLGELYEILDGKRFAVTEAGWHTARQKYKSGPLNLCTKTSEYSRAEVATWARWDIDFWRKAGAELYTWFQIRDGAPGDEHHDSHFGAFEADQTEKLVAQSLASEAFA